ncbi:MAG: hypothetical protein HY777_10025 [Betaproteobacteria bacterium]|nr:hypothetical protein [Betaproteobacteria bacterium]
MQALLSFDQAPPFAAPFRFFVTAPVFAILAGVLLLSSGPELFASRWTPGALALTHLLTAGFMMQAMLGAMVQILPVVAGAHVVRPLRVATIVHAAMTAGTLLLVAAFLSYTPLFFGLAAGCLGLGATVYIGATAHALYRVPSTTPTIGGLKLAMLGLGVTVGLGLVLAISLGGSFPMPLLQLANIHLTWGVVAWGSVLLAAVAYVVVPMFQLTPAYPDWFGRAYSVAALTSVALWTAADLAGWELASGLLSGLVVLVAAVFFYVTLKIQRKSKRAGFDATQRYWRMAMFSALAASVLWLVARSVPQIGEWHGWPLLLGVLLLVGGFMSVIVGMLYKIVPFLVWMHLQNLGRGRLMAPNMKKVLSERQMVRQMTAHFAAFALLVLAVFWPEWLVYPAGVAMIAANTWLLYNLLSAAGVYRHHLKKIEALLVAST